MQCLSCDFLNMFVNFYDLVKVETTSFDSAKKLVCDVDNAIGFVSYIYVLEEIVESCTVKCSIDSNFLFKTISDEELIPVNPPESV